MAELKKRKLFLDFDNTIVNTTQAIVYLYNEDFQYYKDFNHVNWRTVDTYSFEECTLASKDYINTYFNQPRFFRYLDFMSQKVQIGLSDVQLYLNILKELFDVTIVSLGYSPNLKGKIKWLENNNLDKEHGFNFTGVNMKEYKFKSHIDMSGGILVDDNARMLETSNASTKICFGEVHSWNDTWKGLRAKDWKELIYMLCRKEVQ